MKKKITAADLFCGAGGTSTGLRLACEAAGKRLELIAINHWDLAILAHKKNHPEAEHLCANLDSVNPRELVPTGKLDLLVASPECTHHSNAAGGRPKNEQSRASAWRVVEWAAQIWIDEILIENVPEFQSWGPLTSHGQPAKRLKGATYMAFLNALRSLGYTVEARILCAADYGDPTTRERLFIRAKRGRGPIVWPERTHAPKEEIGARLPLFSDGRALKPHRPVSEVIDWSIPSHSIFARKRPLRPNTLKRIFKGIEKFSGLPFIVPQLSGGAPRSVERPLQTITTTSRGIGLCEPFIIELRKNKSARSINQPLSTVCGSGAHHGLCEPFIIPLNHGGQDIRCYSVDRPMKTVTSFDAWGLVRPFLVKYYGTAIGQSVDEPLGTVTVNDRFGLVQPVIEADGQRWKLDINFRMLQPRELAGAQGFPNGYEFEGTREDQVKQIGNAVPVNLATALCSAILSKEVSQFTLLTGESQ